MEVQPDHIVGSTTHNVYHVARLAENGKDETAIAIGLAIARSIRKIVAVVVKKESPPGFESLYPELRILTPDTRLLLPSPDVQCDENPLFETFMRVARRPVIVLGRHHCSQSFVQWALGRGVPIVATETTTDLISSTHNLFIGRIGVYGDRAGNFAVQNADVVILIGEIDPSPRFAREAHVVQIGSNAGACHLRLGGLPLRPTPPARPDWIARCRHWKQRWLAELPPSVSDSDLHPYLFYSFFYQTFTDPKMIVATVDDKWFFPAYQQLQNNPGDRFVPCPFPEDLIAFVSSLETTLPIFLFLGGRRFLSITEFQELVHLNIFIVCLNDVSRTLTSEEYDERIESDTLWYPEEVAEATGVPFLSLDTDTFTDITALVGVDGPYFIEVQCTEDFTPHPRGRKDLPLELMEPFLHWTDIQGEMLIEPIYPK